MPLVAKTCGKLWCALVLLLSPKCLQRHLSSIETFSIYSVFTLCRLYFNAVWFNILCYLVQFSVAPLQKILVFAGVAPTRHSGSSLGLAWAASRRRAKVRRHWWTAQQPCSSRASCFCRWTSGGVERSPRVASGWGHQGGPVGWSSCFTQSIGETSEGTARDENSPGMCSINRNSTGDIPILNI